MSEKEYTLEEIINKSRELNVIHINLMNRFMELLEPLDERSDFKREKNPAEYLTEEEATEAYDIMTKLRPIINMANHVYKTDGGYNAFRHIANDISNRLNKRPFFKDNIEILDNFKKYRTHECRHHELQKCDDKQFEMCMLERCVGEWTREEIETDMLQLINAFQDKIKTE